MSKRWTVVTFVLVAVAFGIGWALRGASERPPTAPTDVAETVDLRNERDRLRTELARLRRNWSQAALTGGASGSNVAGLGPASATGAAVEAARDETITVVQAPEPPATRGLHTPALRIAGFEAAASWGDWRLVAGLVRHRRLVMQERIRLLATGGDVEAFDDEHEDALQWTEEALYSLTAGLPAQLGSSPFESLSHPVPTANVLAAILASSNLPLTSAQSAQVTEVARRWGEQETRAAARDAAREDVSFLRRLMNRVERRDEFLAAAFSVLTPEQAGALRPAPAERTLGSDFFSAAPILVEYVDGYHSPPGWESSMAEFLTSADGPGLRDEPEAVRERVFAIAREWEITVPRAAWPYDPSGECATYRVEFARNVTAAQARLHDRWLLEAGLGEEARRNLREPRDIFMVEAERPAAR